MIQPGGPGGYLGGGPPSRLFSCEGCGKAFAVDELIQYRVMHLTKWVCLDCHDGMEWKREEKK